MFLPVGMVGDIQDPSKMMPGKMTPDAVLRFSTVKWSLVAGLIRWRIDSKISHVEWELPDGSTFGARFSLVGKIRKLLGMRQTVSWKYWDGVYKRPPESTAKQVNVIHGTFHGCGLAYEWAVRFLTGAPYDLAGILGIALADGWHEHNDKYCSETIETSAESGPKVELVDADPSAVTPRDLLVSPLIHTWNGDWLPWWPNPETVVAQSQSHSTNAQTPTEK